MFTKFGLNAYGPKGKTSLRSEMTAGTNKESISYKKNYLHDNE